MQKLKDEQIDWEAADTSLMKFSLWFIVIQFAVVWIGNFAFSSNVEISRVVHSFFIAMDDVTPALARLKVAYHTPLKGREFSQVFSIYFLLLALLVLYLIALCGLSLSRKFRSLPWVKMFSGKYAILLPFFPFGCWEIYEFYAGPSGSLRNCFGMFGASFIDSQCIQLPGAEFLILCMIAFYSVIGEHFRQQS